MNIGLQSITKSRNIDPLWWTSGVVDGEPIADALARRDVAKVFRFLRGHGWSRYAIASATGMSENAVRQIWQGGRKVEHYGVLARIAEGLHIPPAAMGLGQADGTTR